MKKSEKINLVNILVNTENYRFDTAASQKESIDIMIEDQNDKLFRLAEHIIINGLNPNDIIQVSPSSHDKLKFNVLEGNRRVIALKLLNNPDLIDHPKHHTLKRKFKKLHDENKSSIIKEVECIIYDDPSEADKWIKLKHVGQSNGIGTVDWDAQQVHRFEEKVEGKSSAALQVINLLKKNTDIPEEIKNNLGNLKITNLDRLVSDPDVRSFLGIDISNGIIQSEIDEKEVIKGLKHIIKDLLDPKFKVKKIYTKDDRKDYIDKIPKSSRPVLAKKAVKPWDFTKTSSSTSSGIKSTGAKKSNSTERKCLIPRSCLFNIIIPKVNSIYHELQRIDITKFSNAVAFSFRVFVELSLDCYIESNQLASVNIDSRLITKITEVSKHMEANGFADKHICKGIRNSAGNPDDLLGIGTWNAYVHNARFSATPNNLRITWDNIQVFVEKLWENVK